ncbi:uncharacterized protein METZ01_LOCUS11452 [marine metagenome]|uniref:Dihydrolipoyllysine-residue acetyltransferase n=1 Tax=marine metagenome TaxID=408172 RepID=A0A381NXG2_9ZZZZ
MSSIEAITVPQWGLTMTEGTLVKWNASEGDAVQEKGEIAEIETEKIVNVLESPADGILRKIIGKEGDTLPVGALIGILASESTPEKDIDKFIEQYKPIELSAPSQSTNEVTSSNTVSSVPPSTSAPGEGRVSPAVKRLAKKLGVDLTEVSGSGRNGRISKEDVELASKDLSSNTENEVQSDNNDNPFDSIPLTSMRKTIAKRLTESKQNIPHFYLTADYSIDKLLVKRKEMNKENLKISVNDLLIYCVARALIEEPRANVQLIEDEIRQYRHADISVAVATDSGLIAPIVKKADTKSIQEISEEFADLAKRAQKGKLRREEILGGTFSVSNLGMFGIKHFEAIINPPQGAILAIGGAIEKIIASEGKPLSANIMSVSLSCDHRVIDGAVGAKFLQALRKHVEEPE